MSLLSQASLVLTPNAIAEDKLYSIVPSNGNGDMAVTRATTATRVNSEGFIEEVPYNLVKYSEMFTDASWAKSNTSVTANVINAPNGTLTADLVSRSSTTLGCQVAQLYLSTKSNTYTGVIYAKLGTISTNFGLRILGVYPDRGDALFNLSTGTLIGVSNGGTNTGTSATITNVGNGWFKLSITTNFPVISTSLQLQFGATALNSINTWEGADGVLSNAYIWGAQLIQGSIPKDYFPTTDRLNVPRLNYDVAGGCPSILLEPQRTNLLVNTIWAGGGSVPTGWSNGIPTGTAIPVTSIKNPNVSAYRFVTSAQRIEFNQNIAISLNSITCLSVYVESVVTAISINNMLRMSAGTGTGTSVFLKNNVVVSGLLNIEAGFTYSLQFTCTLADTFSIRVGSGSSGNTTGNFVLSMPQLEQGAYPTSYIPTLASTVTRNADVISRNNIYTNGLITSAGGTWFVELNNNLVLTRDTSSGGLYLSDNIQGGGGTANTFGFNFAGATGRLLIYKRVSNSYLSLYTTLTDTIKVAIKWNGITADVFVNGVKVVTNTVFTTTNMEFLNGSGADVPKYIKSTLLFPTPLSDSECAQLTTL